MAATVLDILHVSSCWEPAALAGEREDDDSFALLATHLASATDERYHTATSPSESLVEEAIEKSAGCRWDIAL